MGALRCAYGWIAVRILVLLHRMMLKICTPQEIDQARLADLSSYDPEATEPALGVYPWDDSDTEFYNSFTFQKIFRLNEQPGWRYYTDPDNPKAQIPPEPRLDPKISSKLEKLDKSKLAQRGRDRHALERCRIVLLPYLEAAVERFEKARTVPGKYKLLRHSTKAKDMPYRGKEETRRLIVDAHDTITFTNAEGQRRELLAVIVGGHAYTHLLAYMGIVHTNRKERGEKKRVVYGIATDGYYFSILKIDNESNLRETYTYSVHLDFWIFLKYLHIFLAEAAEQCEGLSTSAEKLVDDCCT